MFKLFLNSFFLAVAILCSISLFAEEVAPQLQTENEPAAIAFEPPVGWKEADRSVFPPSIKIMIVGKGEHEFPPSLSLGTEAFEGTLQDYIKIIKSINQAKGIEWKDLGLIRTGAGDASLSQIFNKTQWGNIKVMNAILVKNGTVYILTAAALQEEFPKFYKEFFAAMRSLHFKEKV
jgi:hypothetical protein